MAGGIRHDFVADYVSGKSLTEIASKYKASISGVRYHVKKAGALRTRSEGISMARDAGKLGSGMRGKTRSFSTSHKEAIRAARKLWGAKNARGVSVKPNGYLEYTTGPHKGRHVHVVVMEARLGRRIRSDEHVHHIDGDKLNNNENNLALVTRSGHMRLHRFEERLAGVVRKAK